MSKAIKRNHKRGRPVGSGNGASRPLDAKQVQQLLGVCIGARGLRNRALIALLVHSGMRINTALRLQISDVVHQGRCKDTICIAANREKSKRSHNYIVSRQGQQIINDYISTLDQHQLIRLDDAFFPSARSGSFMPASSGSRLIGNLLKKAGIPNQSSHCGRKTFAAALLNAGIGIESVSMALNHADLNVTSRYCGDIRPNTVKAVQNLKY